MRVVIPSVIVPKAFNLLHRKLDLEHELDYVQALEHCSIHF